ncbi:HepT-like ribonuclease domain-containing protein [Aureimonas leprariae]|uniref:DUF86 domain-containing protein n=1 Tax=Plantimonas leprariae TaxID=2615207 RepID=A0A7V7PQZ3_9HYPH|nr:HepT-like ribonuclease domain-containing protein [Aureimonas leprariae]KAB0680775.1 DUF86 domain-containing protein [Aureimonas leprariae]
MAKAARGLPELLTDLVNWGERVERVLSLTSTEAIRKDELAELALARGMEIFGEISGRLIREHPEWASEESRTELRYAYRLRNKLAHDYDDIDLDTVHKIASTDIRRLTEAARRWLDEIDAPRKP